MILRGDGDEEHVTGFEYHVCSVAHPDAAGKRHQKHGSGPHAREEPQCQLPPHSPGHLDEAHREGRRGSYNTQTEGTSSSLWSSRCPFVALLNLLMNEQKHMHASLCRSAQDGLMNHLYAPRRISYQQ